jgi:hypothetical protein
VVIIGCTALREKLAELEAEAARAETAEEQSDPEQTP